MSYESTPQTFYVPSMSHDEVPDMDNFDAKASLGVNIRFMKSTFRFSTTNLNLADEMTILQDLRFYTTNPIGARSLAGITNGLENCLVYQGYIVSGQNNISVDFIQSLAFKMFGSADYTTFFRNTNKLIEDIVNDIRNSYNNISINAIKAISDTIGYDPDLQTDSDGKLYLDGSVTDSKNIGRIIMATLYRKDPGRFNVENGLVTDTTDIQDIPLVVGDKLQFILTLRPSVRETNASNNNQGSFPNGETVAYLTRKYLIELEIEFDDRQNVR